MTAVIDNICKIRDILEYRQYDRLGYLRQLCPKIFDDVHKHIKRKADDYKYELDFTAQDLRETAQAISDMFAEWDSIMNPEKNTKELKDTIKDGKLSLNKFMDKVLPIMAYRKNYTEILTELRSLLEYHSVYLYFLEYAANDEFAIKCTERL